MSNKIAHFRAQTPATTGMTRVFINGTAFFVTDLAPYVLMGQRGEETHFIQQLDEICYNERELRNMVNSLKLEQEYLDVMFDTPAPEVSWHHAV